MADFTKSFLHNGKVTNASTLEITADSSLISAGVGFFETVLYNNQKLYFWQRHINRLKNSLAYFSKTLRTNLPTQNIVESFLIDQNGPTPARVKLIAYPNNDKTPWDWTISFQTYQPPAGEFCLKISDDTADYPLLKHKSLNYWQNLIHIQSVDSNTEIARKNRFGKVNECARTNILLIKNRILCFAGFQNNYLAGITQQILLDNYEKIGFTGIKSANQGFSITNLKAADAIILTNSLMPIAGVNILQVNNQDFRIKSDINLVKSLIKFIDKQ